MPKILRITNRLNLGGPTFNAALLTKHLAPNFETMLLAGMKEESEASSEFILNKLDIKASYIPNMYRSINPMKDVQAYRHIKKIIKSYKPDIVHTHAAKSGALGRLAAAECGVPVIVHTFHGHVFHSYFGAFKTRFYLEAERMLAKMSHKIVAISDKQKHDLTQVYKVCEADKVGIVPLGFDLSRFEDEQVDKRIEFRRKYRIADDEIAIGIVGRLVPIKNHGLFLNALAELKQKTTKKVRAFIVGDGEEREHIEALAKELQLDFVTEKSEPSQTATLTFTSWIKAVDEVYAGIDIVALSSLNEGTPVSLIEAQAANKAIVSTNVGGVTDVVSENETALLSASCDVAAYAENLLRLVEDDALRNRLAENGNKFVAQKYGYQRLVNDVSSLYFQLLKQAKPDFSFSPAHKNFIQTANMNQVAAQVRSGF